ncbi:MAG: hypothetical protein O7G88_19310 [bacterium]|nr:hypothetical protein [bacterium]
MQRHDLSLRIFLSTSQAGTINGICHASDASLNGNDARTRCELAVVFSVKRLKILSATALQIFRPDFLRLGLHAQKLVYDTSTDKVSMDSIADEYVQLWERLKERDSD